LGPKIKYTPSLGLLYPFLVRLQWKRRARVHLGNDYEPRKILSPLFSSSLTNI
jgi:hypothetical protein